MLLCLWVFPCTEIVAASEKCTMQKSPLWWAFSFLHDLYLFVMAGGRWRHYKLITAYQLLLRLQDGEPLPSCSLCPVSTTHRATWSRYSSYFAAWAEALRKRLILHLTPKCLILVVRPVNNCWATLAMWFYQSALPGCVRDFAPDTELQFCSSSLIIKECKNSRCCVLKWNNI